MDQKLAVNCWMNNEWMNKGSVWIESENELSKWINLHTKCSFYTKTFV